ncbi:GntR family transcriptional regulator [Pseudonocardia sp. KRD291]|uniref:GntR family transcriptional regulator n=1 Tax=Pseudonocardia sp. KRD291 TaxID=2792007 RepID=UPI0027E34B9C|nr:GntR family transcriptional regulator [Pseudonocardia sp. KRD291]
MDGGLPGDARRPRARDDRQLSERVAGHLREAIMAGEVQAGEFVRTEHLAEQLGVSATPVREALMILHSEGAVRWEPRRGFRVSPLSRGDVTDLFAVQAFIAGELAARAATALPDGEVDRLRAVQHALEAAARAGDAAEVDRLNHDIHRTVNRAADARRLSTVLRTLVQYVPLGYFGQVRGWADASAHDHGAVLDALERRDAGAAREAMAAHVRHIGGLLAEHLSEHGALDGSP